MAEKYTHFTPGHRWKIRLFSFHVRLIEVTVILGFDGTCGGKSLVTRDVILKGAFYGKYFLPENPKKKDNEFYLKIHLI